MREAHVHRNDRVTRLLQERRLLEHHEIGMLDPCEIGQEPFEHAGLPVQGALFPDPPDAAVGSADPVRDLERLVLGEGDRYRRMHLVAVFRQDDAGKRQPRLGGKRRGRVAGHFFDAVADEHHAPLAVVATAVGRARQVTQQQVERQGIAATGCGRIGYWLRQAHHASAVNRAGLCRPCNMHPMVAQIGPLASPECE